MAVDRTAGHCKYPAVGPEVGRLLLPAAKLATAVLGVVVPVATAGAL